MRQIFISYSHADTPFVERMAEDLKHAGVEAVYDRWLLNVGDSIFEKLSAAVSDADGLIVVLSPASVASQWVSAELGLAMATVLKNRNASVYPVIIADCQPPPSLADRKLADFRKSYYNGIRELLQAISPEVYARNEHRYRKREEVLQDYEELKSLLDVGDLNSIRFWFAGHYQALVALFGRLWLISETIPRFSFEVGKPEADFVVVNGTPSFFEFLAIQVGPVDFGAELSGEIVRQFQNLEFIVKECRRDEDRFRRAVSLRMKRGGAPLYPALQSWSGPALYHHHREIVGKVLCGRRYQYDSAGNSFRNRLYESSDKAVEIISYDRVLEALAKIEL